MLQEELTVSMLSSIYLQINTVPIDFSLNIFVPFSEILTIVFRFGEWTKKWWRLDGWLV